MAASIFSFISKDHLQDVLETLHSFAGLRIQLLDDEGRLLMSFGDVTSYCTLLKKHVFDQRECLKLHKKASRQAQVLGGAYIFTCHANLNHIAFPLMNQHDLLGSIITGPFLMDRPDSTLVSDLAEGHKLSPTLSLELYDELVNLQIIPPDRVNYLSRLINHLLSPLLSSERALLLQSSERLYQQSRINETIQMYKAQEAPQDRSCFFEKEKALMHKVRMGNVEEAKATLNDLLGYLFYSEGTEPEIIRTRCLGMTALLAYMATEGGAKAESIYDLEHRFQALMRSEENAEKLCYLMQDVVESFMSAMLHPMDHGNPYIRRALQYIARHYSQPLTIATVAREVGLSPNYFSTLFLKIVGFSFHEFLAQVRIRESCRLLLSTDYSLTDIAVAVGFLDQSIFCKTFKRIMAISPGKYRNQG